MLYVQDMEEPGKISKKFSQLDVKGLGGGGGVEQEGESVDKESGRHPETSVLCEVGAGGCPG